MVRASLLRGVLSKRLCRHVITLTLQRANTRFYYKNNTVDLENVYTSSLSSVFGVDFNSVGIDEILEEEPFCSLSAAGLSRLRLRLLALSLWHGCDLKDMQLRSLDFSRLGDKPLKGGQVGEKRRGRLPPLVTALYQTTAPAWVM